ncbi:hypothetical protein GCM10011357_31270 [Lacimicrobium alkaliphilum]|uniref:DUF6265 domain-containing protein n=2 Tax=Lacimicrobium alkaliphilum TaxID=1526571 RepID=A0ABQ1RNA4_9ALTE|nr:hypothetical protein GCM10011357_31270 [Lacimicrobium alkaliphilum]
MLDGKASGSGEMWTEPLGNMLLGIGFMSKQDNVSRYEYMRIEKRESGEIYFVAIPSGQQETEFRLTQHTEKRVVFENPAHDFPQRITYSQIAEGVMQAKAGSKKDDSYKGFELTLLRTDCQSPSR